MDQDLEVGVSWLPRMPDMSTKGMCTIKCWANFMKIKKKERKKWKITLIKVRHENWGLIVSIIWVQTKFQKVCWITWV